MNLIIRIWVIAEHGDAAPQERLQVLQVVVRLLAVRVHVSRRLLEEHSVRGLLEVEVVQHSRHAGTVDLVPDLVEVRSAHAPVRHLLSE